MCIYKINGLGKREVNRCRIYLVCIKYIIFAQAIAYSWVCLEYMHQVHHIYTGHCIFMGLFSVHA